LTRSEPADGKKRRGVTETPMMGQYLRAKAEYPDAILLFRMGDFYETFFEDAQVLSRETGVVLTSRNSSDPEPIPLAGFPWHQGENYVAKLLRAGHRVAICEQVEEPGKGKKLLERRVIEVLSPGTTLNDGVLAAGSDNFLVAIRPEGERIGLAAADISTGAFFLGDLDPERAREEIARLAPAEALLPKDAVDAVLPLLRDLAVAPFRSEADAWEFGRERGRKALLEQFGVQSLDAFEAENLGPALGAAGALLDYARRQKQSELKHLRPPRLLRPDEGLVLDEATLRSLEVLEPMPGGDTSSTLFAVLDRTLTPGGTRRLRRELRRPPSRAAEITARQDAVAALLDGRLRAGVRQALKGTSDLERILGRLHCGRLAPRDLAALRSTLRAVPELARLAAAVPAGTLPAFETLALPALRTRLDAALADQPPALLSDGGVFREGWDPRLDELRGMSRDAKGWVARLQEEERASTGISGLKVGFNRVFGYYIEITQSQLPRVPERYIRKQTLAGAERFITPELKEFEGKILHAEEESLRLEKELFDAIGEEVRAETATLQELASHLAGLDFRQALAEAAATGRWVRPVLLDEPRLTIRDGRHPVVEQALGPGKFVANDTLLDAAVSPVAILTGPNMAGKSTYLRQVGLIAVLTHLGSYVPAREAEVGLCDRVFTRVGAQDALARGQSTFLVEMIETSRILHHATARSLVLLDEVGRGTSTYDGLAIAWAVAEALESADGPRPRTLFATHFHELTKLAAPGRGFVNLSVEVKEWGDRVVFLRRVVEGAADRSYGIQVARLAGVPDEVIERAKEILLGLERRGAAAVPHALAAAVVPEGAGGPGVPGGSAGDGARPGAAPRAGGTAQLHLFAPPDPGPLRELRELDPDRLTPLEALALLHRWRTELDGAPPR
jgi:DNA mismatch repair protein MutS